MICEQESKITFQHGLLALPVNLYLTVVWKSTRNQNSRSDEIG